MTPKIVCALVFGLLVVIGVVILIVRLRRMTRQTMDDVGAFAEKAVEEEAKRADAALAEVAELRAEAKEIKEELLANHEKQKEKHDAIDRAVDHAGVDAVIYGDRRE